jgi:hypothetical protein
MTRGENFMCVSMSKQLGTFGNWNVKSTRSFTSGCLRHKKNGRGSVRNEIQTLEPLYLPTEDELKRECELIERQKMLESEDGE